MIVYQERQFPTCLIRQNDNLPKNDEMFFFKGQAKIHIATEKLTFIKVLFQQQKFLFFY